MADFDAYSGYGGAPMPLRDPQKPLKSVVETGSSGCGLQIPFGGEIPSFPRQGYGVLDPEQEGFIAFKNIPPRTRLQRRQMQDKESLEKARLRERRGAYHKYVDPGAVIAPDDPSADGYIAESERFLTDVAAEEKCKREERQKRRAQEILRKREEAVARDERRWKNMEEEEKIEQERVEKLRAQGTKAKSNQKSTPYDPLTLNYDNSEAGKKLKERDDKILKRAAQRAKTLQEKSRGASYDIISGADKNITKVPNLPDPDH